MTKEDDIRYQGTERTIRAVYLELVKDNAVEHLSVTQLCNKARISRNAFYQHYSNLNELFSTMIDEVVLDVQAKSLESSERVLASGAQDTMLNATIIDALSSHEELLRTILPPDAGAIASRLADGIAKAYITAALLFGEHGASAEHRMSCSYAAWGLIGLLRTWISNTERPIKELLPYFEAEQSAISSKATDYLLRV